MKKLSSEHFAFINSTVNITTPKSFNEVKKSKEWCAAVDDEFVSLERLDTEFHRFMSKMGFLNILSHLEGD